MRRTQELLADPSNSVAELARRFGYNSEASFHRAFKRVVGVTPGSYRRTVAQ
jgi:AraC-like DNA-binding protein